MQAGVVGRDPAGAGHGVLEHDIKPPRIAHRDPDGDGLVTLSARPAQLVELLFQRRLLRLQVLALVVERLHLGRDLPERFLGINVELLPFVERRPRRGAAAARSISAEGVNDGSGGGQEHALHKVALFVENPSAIVEPPLLFLQFLQLFLQLLDSLVGREIHVGGLGVHIEDGDARRAAAGGLQRLVEQPGRQALENERLLATDKFDRGHAGDDRAVEINRRGGNMGFHGCGMQEIGGGEQYEAGQSDGFHENGIEP